MVMVMLMVGNDDDMFVKMMDIRVQIGTVHGLERTANVNFSRSDLGFILMQNCNGAAMLTKSQ